MIDTVFLNGTVGTGKSTIAAALSVLMAESGRHHAVIDLDDIRRAWPAPQDDRFNHELELLNLRDLVVNYRNAGIEHFVLAGVLEHATEVPRFEAALKSRGLLLCRLEADAATLSGRLRSRHADNSAELSHPPNGGNRSRDRGRFGRRTNADGKKSDEEGGLVRARSI